MAQLISAEALEREREQHAREKPEGPHRLPGYGITGWRWRDEVLALAERIGAKSVLDYGAGKGSLAASMVGDVRCYDPVTFPAEPKPADIVVCTDVLEHVEPGSLDAVLSHIERLAEKGVLIAVPKHRPEKASPALTIEEPSWWRFRLSAYWPSHEADVVRWSASQRFVPCVPWSTTQTPRLRFIGFA